jgi:hypothetical protein
MLLSAAESTIYRIFTVDNVWIKQQPSGMFLARIASFFCLQVEYYIGTLEPW